MNSTADRAFLYTNILIYMYSDDEPAKQTISCRLVSDLNPDYVISTQVIGEFINILVRKYAFDLQIVKVAIDDFEKNFQMGIIQVATIEKALYVMERYKFSYWDSLIIASALENQCMILYSEDLQHYQEIEGTLKIVNPFQWNQE